MMMMMMIFYSGDLNAFDEIILASYAIQDKEIPSILVSDIQKPMNHPSSLTLINFDPMVNLSSSVQLTSPKVPVNLMNLISALLNKTLDSLAIDGEAKQSLIENITSLSKAALPSSVQPLYQSLCRFMEDLLKQVPKVKAAENSFTQFPQNLESFGKELQESMKSKNLAALKLAIGKAQAKDMSSEIAIVEQRLKDLKEKKENLDKAVGKLQVDIIKAENKSSRKQIHH